MKIIFRRLFIHEIIAVLTLLMFISPLLYSRINPLWIVIVSIIWILTAWYSDERAFYLAINDRIVLLSIIYPIMLLLLSLIRNDTIFEKRSLFDIIIVIMGLFYSKQKNKRHSRFILTTIITFLVLMSFVSIYQLHRSPNLARIMASDLSSNHITLFTGGYGAVYSVVFISIGIFGIICQLRKAHISVKRLMVVLLVYSLFILRAQYVMAALLLLIGLIIVYFEGSRRKRLFSISLVITILLLVVFDIINISQLFYKMASAVPVSSFFHTRFIQLGRLFYNFSSASLESMGKTWIRLRIYMDTFDAFKSNLLWGVGNKVIEEIGNHSTILDQFGSFGIICGSVFLLTRVIMLREIKSKLDYRVKHIYSTISLVYLIFAFLNNAEKNEFTLVLFLVIPLFLEGYIPGRNKYIIPDTLLNSFVNADSTVCVIAQDHM